MSPGATWHGQSWDKHFRALYQGEGSHQYQYRSVNCRYPVIKRAIIAINKTVNIITQYNTSHYTCQTAGKRRRGYICLCPALWRGKHIQRKGAYQRYWPHRDLCRSTDYNWNRVQMVENIEYWSDSFLVPENHIVSKFLHQNLTRKEASQQQKWSYKSLSLFPNPWTRFHFSIESHDPGS